MTVDEIIEDILLSEGPGDPAKGYLAKNDRGGRTNWGISEKAHPEEWANGKVPSRERAAEIYRTVYALPWAWCHDWDLRAQLVDWCVLHGEGRTWKWMARAIGLGYLTRYKSDFLIDNVNSRDARLINNTLVAARLKLIDEISDADVKQKANEEGWENRALRFLLLD